MPAGCRERIAAVDPDDSSDDLNPSAPSSLPEPSVNSLPEGTVLPFSEGFLHRYRVIGFLGQGGMGSVFLMAQLPFERPVAVKVIRSEAYTPFQKKRFELEGLAL